MSFKGVSILEWILWPKPGLLGYLKEFLSTDTLDCLEQFCIVKAISLSIQHGKI